MSGKVENHDIEWIDGMKITVDGEVVEYDHASLNETFTK